MRLPFSLEQILSTVAVEKREPIAEKECQRHGRYHSFWLLYLGESISVDSCPLCQNEKIARWKKEVFRNFSEVIEVEIHDRIPKRFWNASVATFETPTSQMRMGKERVKEFILSPEGKNLVILGRPGTGKTHLGYGIYRYFLILNKVEDSVNGNSTHKPVFTTALEMVRGFKECWRQYSLEENRHHYGLKSERELIRQYGDAYILIIDEVGVQFQSGAENVIFSEIINYRYERMMPTVLLSNLSIGGFKNLLGERIIDRLRLGIWLAFDWRSWRS